jgi:peptidoglycan/LPS O-acetylase OafA/YrhL
MCVLFGHANTPLLGLAWLPATTAVEVFFVISGFYMQMILSEKYTHAKLGRRWWEIFYLARYSRLFPAYLAALVLTVLAALVAYRLGKSPPPFQRGWPYLT